MAAAAKLNAEKMKYVFHGMWDSAGGTAQASAKLNAQLMTIVSEKPFHVHVWENLVHETRPS